MDFFRLSFCTCSGDRGKKILLERTKLSEYNGVNLSDIISQDIQNTQTLLDTELRLYIDDLRLSQIKTELLNRFRLKL